MDDFSSPWRMSVLRCDRSCRSPGYALYQTSVGSWCRRSMYLNFCSFLAPSRSSQLRPRIAEAVAEDDVQSKADLVDEVVHVAFEAAIVVAGEQHAPLVVDEDPAREVNRGHACQPSAVEDVSRGVIDHPQDEGQHPAAKQTGLEAAHGAELVGDVVIFQDRELVGVCGIDARSNLRIGCFSRRRS